MPSASHKVVFSPEAKSDLLEPYDYIAQSKAGLADHCRTSGTEGNVRRILTGRSDCGWSESKRLRNPDCRVSQLPKADGIGTGQERDGAAGWQSIGKEFGNKPSGGRRT